MTAIRKARLAVLCTTLSLLLACSDRLQASYPSRADAERSGAIARGWVPSNVPERSTAIREAHNVDTNQTCGRFSFPVAATETFRTELNEIDASSLAGQEVRPPKVNWWPSALSGRLNEQELRATGLKYYKAQQHGVVFFAVDWQKNEAFFWRPGPHLP